MKRTIPTLAGTVVALAALTGVAALTAPGDEPASAATAARKPVERSTLVCPRPTTSDVAETVYTALTPEGGKGDKGSAELQPVQQSGIADDGKSPGKGGRSAEPLLPLKAPGTPVTTSTSSGSAPALTGSAEGRFAPGWTVQQTTEVSAGAGRGLQGTSCAVPDTEFWFPGVSTARERQDYVHLTNPDHRSAVVDLGMYDKSGRQRSEAGQEITVPPRSTVPFRLSTLTEKPTTNGVLRVTAREGRVGAQVQAVDESLGGDWIAAAADPAPEAVLPGIPGDATSVRLVVLAPGDKDADLKVRLAGPSGGIAPAGYETLHVKAGLVKAVDLRNLTQGKAGSLVLSPADDGKHDTPVTAALRVTRGKGTERETAFIPAAVPVDTRATAAGSEGGDTQLSLTATDRAAKVRVTSSAGSDGGSPVSKVYQVKAGTTRSFAPPRPEGGGGMYAVTVERLSGGPVYAARTLQRKQDGVPAFTVQTLPDDRGTVRVPEASRDLSVLTED